MTKLNPLKLLIGWTLLMILLTPIFVYTSSIGSIGGEQKPLTTLVAMPLLAVIGAAVICIVTPFIFKSWFKSNKWFIALALFILIPTIIFSWQYYFETPYSYVQKFEEIDGNKFEIKTEYYDGENKVVRSNSFWKNGKRDSSWTVLSKDGTVISEEVYRNDSLVERK
jgi:Na+/melibiose symporter-like transporter